MSAWKQQLGRIPQGTHCAALPFQVYLISDIAQWNADRSSDAVFGGKGRHHRIYSATLIDCLNTRCQKLFGETEELLGLEYLFRAWVNWDPSCSRTSSTMDLVPRKRWFSLDTPIQARTTKLTTATWRCETAFWMSLCPASPSQPMTSTVNPPEFEDACSPNPRPGFQKLETFYCLLVESCLAENKFSLTTEKSLKPGMQWRNMISSHRSLISCTGPTWVTPSSVGRNGMILLPPPSSRGSRWLSVTHRLNKTSVPSTIG
ncbi:uncharacterized protein LOC113654739 [Tachysurus fulvidraco]|uniref:uncharacterized protein LOC113654739 n=1 Tax=Tachysurus fulvidraco TaxID=1234273 RepID=UPI001FEF21FC|nr:uncharacterized protein LOC113654739 [Tachysurus fulvidraco]XP_047674034.1 uncharacterized protein LOC113654739 [Tachysurus fulvidraco]